VEPDAEEFVFHGVLRFVSTLIVVDESCIYIRRATGLT
jgi:hypothetical protein